MVACLLVRLGVPSYQVAASADPSLDPIRVEGLVVQNLWVHQEVQREDQIRLLVDQILQVAHVVVQILLEVRNLPLAAQIPPLGDRSLPLVVPNLHVLQDLLVVHCPPLLLLGVPIHLHRLGNWEAFVVAPLLLLEERHPLLGVADYPPPLVERHHHTLTCWQGRCQECDPCRIAAWSLVVVWQW